MFSEIPDTLVSDGRQEVSPELIEFMRNVRGKIIISILIGAFEFGDKPEFENRLLQTEWQAAGGQIRNAACWGV